MLCPCSFLHRLLLVALITLLCLYFCFLTITGIIYMCICTANIKCNLWKQQLSSGLKMNHVKKDLNKWRDFPCTCIGIVNIVKMAGFPNLIYRSTYFVDTNKLILVFIWRDRRPRRANPILKEKDNVRRHTTKLQDFCKATVTKTVCYWLTDQ